MLSLECIVWNWWPVRNICSFYDIVSIIFYLKETSVAIKSNASWWVGVKSQTDFHNQSQQIYTFHLTWSRCGAPRWFSKYFPWLSATTKIVMLSLSVSNETDEQWEISALIMPAQLKLCWHTVTEASFISLLSCNQLHWWDERWERGHPTPHTLGHQELRVKWDENWGGGHPTTTPPTLGHQKLRVKWDEQWGGGHPTLPWSSGVES